MNILTDLFLSFAKIGLFTFGGGYAMLPVIEHTCIERKNWITHDEMMEITVLAESTPGPIAINCATYVGYRQRGITGSVAATLGIVTPSIAVIYLIALLLDNFLEIRWVAGAFSGIKLAVGILIIDAAIRMMKKMPKKAMPRVITVCAALAMALITTFSLNFSSVAVMLLCGAVSLALFTVWEKGGKKS